MFINDSFNLWLHVQGNISFQVVAIIVTLPPSDCREDEGLRPSHTGPDNENENNNIKNARPQLVEMLHAEQSICPCSFNQSRACIFIVKVFFFVIGACVTWPFVIINRSVVGVSQVSGELRLSQLFKNASFTFSEYTYYQTTKLLNKFCEISYTDTTIFSK